MRVRGEGGRGALDLGIVVEETDPAVVGLGEDDLAHRPELVDEVVRDVNTLLFQLDHRHLRVLQRCVLRRGELRV